MNSNNSETAIMLRPQRQTTERKIGKTTFIVSTRFNDGKERDVFNILARLIQNDKGESA